MCPMEYGEDGGIPDEAIAMGKEHSNGATVMVTTIAGFS